MLTVSCSAHATWLTDESGEVFACGALLGAGQHGREPLLIEGVPLGPAFVPVPCFKKVLLVTGAHSNAVLGLALDAQR